MARARRSFTKEYKAEVVKLIRSSGKSVGAVSRELGLTETSVRAWVKQADIDEKKDPLGPMTSEERAENTRLRRELKRVTMERDFLGQTSWALRRGLSASSRSNVCRARGRSPAKRWMQPSVCTREALSGSRASALCKVAAKRTFAKL